MTDTPRTDAEIQKGWPRPTHQGIVSADFARQLERDLIVAQGLEHMAYDQRDKVFDALALLRELNDALAIPERFQPRVDAVLDRAEEKP